jgi:hypothetical protein
MEVGMFLAPKLLSALGAVVAAYPAIIACRMQRTIEQIASAKFGDLVLSKLADRVVQSLTLERDNAATNQVCIFGGLSLVLLAQVLEILTQFSQYSAL